MNGLILIPAFQAGPYLGDVLQRILEYRHMSVAVLVVNDGSTDNTEDVARSYGVNVLSHSQNRGKGAALKTGFSFAVQKNFNYVVCLDADGQHDPEAIPDFIDLFQTGNYDLIIGRRDVSIGKMPFDRYLSNSLTSVVVSLVAGQRIHDSQSGYRLLSVELIKRLRLQSHQYETETEILLQAIRDFHARVGEIPISVSYVGEISHINRFSDTLRFIRLVLKTVGHL
ncbi:MAG: glycosyltransferase family 2 protein [Calditrichaeota bacterium]|nr:glycosyltransferase family 2 protein [Calditrichota bacterium]